MKTRNCSNPLVVLILGAVVVQPVYATFHLMQIEQVVGGVNGDATVQAVQLRMRTAFQNAVQASQLRAWDAAGQNPILLIDFTQAVANGNGGDRVLVASANFANFTSPSAIPDFTFTNLIPASYLAAGSMTFEDDIGSIYWRLSWGGASYTGSTTGLPVNDPGGDFGPPWPAALPSSDLQALLFLGAANASSSSNAADYALTGGAAVFTNNARASFTLTKPLPTGACCEDSTGFCDNGTLQGDCEGAGLRYGGDGSTCGTIDPACEPPPLPIAISLEVVAEGLAAPVMATHAGDGSGRLFIVDQSGLILIVDADGSLLPTPFLDLSSKLVDQCPVFDERGLLGLAFHPDYANNGRFFVRYSAPREEPDPPEWCNDSANPLREILGCTFFCHQEVLAEYAVSGDPDLADPNSEIILFRVDEPEFNHDSGHVAFGPDGLLYITLGDGGGANDAGDLNGLCDAGHCIGDDSVCSVSAQDCVDETTCVSDLGTCGVILTPVCVDASSCLPSGTTPHGPSGNGQNPDTLLGSVVRIDVGAGSVLPDDFPGDPERNYAIPPGNPFAGGGGAPEIYAYGFRNPYRFSFDHTAGMLYVGDVGQDVLEEVDVLPVESSPGLLNYGWSVREGFSCFDAFDPASPPATCAEVGPFGEPLLDPVMDYLHPIPCLNDDVCAPFGVGCDLDRGLCANEGGITVIGGFVYRGSAYAPLVANYVFGDFSDNFFVPGARLYYFDTDGPRAFERRQFFLAPDDQPLGRFLKGFGEDQDGELYVAVSEALAPFGDTGIVYRITCPVASQPAPELLKAQINAKNRYISITAGDPGRSQAIRVTFVTLPTPFEVWNGMTFFVGEPREVCENSGKGLETDPRDCPAALPTDTFWAAPLVCSKGAAHSMEWSGYCNGGTCVGGLSDGKNCSVDEDCAETIHLYHEGIVPAGVYDVQVVDSACSLNNEADFSTPLTMVQAAWGDICGPGGGGACSQPADGVVDVQNDVLGVLDKFANVIDLQKTRADLEPGDFGQNNGPDFKVNVANDVLYCLDAFTGAPYPFSPGDPCGAGL